MKYLLFFLIVLVSCSTDETQNPDENPNIENPNNENPNNENPNIENPNNENPNNENPNNENPNNENTTSDGRYKVSFNAPGLNGNIHYKATYIFDGTEEVVDYNDTKTGFKIEDANDRIDLWIEMVDGDTYLNLNHISFKVEDLQTGNVRELNGTIGSNQYIISPDMLTEFDFLNNLYGYNVNTPKNIYKTHFFINLSSYGFASTYGGGGVSPSNYYDYRNDILVHKPTRGSLRIVVDTAPPNLPSQYHLETKQNAWLIKDNSSNPNNGFFNTLEATSTLSQFNDFNSNNVDKTYELILPSHMNELTLKFWGDDATATVYLMKKDGTEETQTITTSNNQLQTLNFNL